MKPIGEDVIAALRAEGDLREVLTALRTDARAECDRRRRIVLAHPDLAEQLTELPCKFASPQAWTGYIGPETTDIDRRGDGDRNTSPYRAQLVALVAEAERRNARTERAA